MSPSFYGGQITEAIALWFDVIAISYFVLRLRTGRAAQAPISGASSFLMAGFRVPCALHGLAYLPLAWALFHAHGARRGAFLVLCFCGGVAVSLLALYVHARALDYWGPFLEVLTWNRQYAALDRVPFRQCSRSHPGRQM